MAVERENNKKLTDFFTEEYQNLNGYVRSRIGGTIESDPEDIVQEVALKLFSRNSPSPIDNIAAFVYRSLRNKIIDVMRTRKPNYEAQEVEDLWSEFAEKFYAPTAYDYPHQLVSRLKGAIAGLKPMYRDIVVAVDFEGYTYREISEQTGISQGTLMSRRHRALSELSKKLELNNT
ncbi:MAG: RNA polymerase sigma factor [Bacteroidota bacterium]